VWRRRQRIYDVADVAGARGLFPELASFDASGLALVEARHHGDVLEVMLFVAIRQALIQAANRAILQARLDFTQAADPTLVARARVFCAAHSLAHSKGAGAVPCAA